MSALDAAARTLAGRIAGTPGYMSPEQLRGRAVDHRTDIYALGILLFELIAGHQPFGGDFVTAAVAALTPPKPRLCDVDASVPAGVDALVARMMSVEPDARPASADYVRSELERLRATIGHVFALPLVIDKKMGFWTAMEVSRLVVHEHWWSTFALVIVLALVAFAGFLLCASAR